MTLSLAQSGRLYLHGIVVGEVRRELGGWVWELVDGRVSRGAYASAGFAARGAGVEIARG